MSFLDVVRIQQEQDRERLTFEHDLQEAQARLQGCEDTYKAYVAEGQAMGTDLKEKNKLLQEREAYCKGLSTKNEESKKNIISLDHVLASSRDDFKVKVQNEEKKQAELQSTLTAAKEKYARMSKDNLIALSINPENGGGLVNKDKVTAKNLEKLKTTVKSLAGQSLRLDEETAEHGRRRASDGRASKRHKMSTEELRKVVSETEERLKALRVERDAKLQERDRLNGQLSH